MNLIDEETTLIELAGIVATELEKRSISVVLVGGAAVSLYSSNEYESKDIDFISPEDHRKITEAMIDIGFKKNGKNFIHKNTKFSIEFPSGPLAIGDSVNIKPEGSFTFKGKSIKVFSPTQAVMDRLAWFYFSNDMQCLDQALMICKKQDVNFKKVKSWSSSEGEMDKFGIFIQYLKKSK